MNPYLARLINDAHRRGLLREAQAERLAHDAQQVPVSEQLRTQAHTPLISVDALLYQASIALAGQEHATLCCDETS